MQLPDFPQVSTEALSAIVERHRLEAKGFSRLRNAGIFNEIYLLGSGYVLRVPREAPPFVAAIRKEAVAVPAARVAGVRTPALIAFNDSLDLLPVPYAIYERVHGETLGLLDLEPANTPAAWREVGRDLARLHEGVSEDGPTADLEPEPLPDPRTLPDELASAGYFTSLEARWLSGWLERLTPAALAPVARRFRHGDLQTTNVMIRRGALEYLALIDWGACGWSDPAHDFAGVPLRAVSFMLCGYRELAPLPEDGRSPHTLAAPANRPVPPRPASATGTFVGRTSGGDDVRDPALLTGLAERGVERCVGGALSRLLRSAFLPCSAVCPCALAGRVGRKQEIGR